MSDYSGFYELLKLLGREGETIRIARGKEGEFANTPIDYAKIPDALDVLTANSYNAWFEINPSTFNRSTGRSNADDISRLTALYADLDFKPKPNGMSTLPECMEVVEALSSIIGYQPSAIVYTGGGIHPYWPILDGEIDEVNRADMQRRLKRWGALVKLTAASHGGDADSVYDLPRILRVPGSQNWKEATPRPTSVDIMQGVGKIDIAWIDEVLDEYQITVDMVDDSQGIVSAMAGWDWAEQNCQFFDTAKREIESSLPTSRHHWALKWSAMLHGMVRNGCVTEEGFYYLRDKVFVPRFEELLKIQGTPRPVGPQEMREVLKFGALKAQGWSKQKLNEELRGHEHFDALEALAPASSIPMLPGDLPPAPTNVSSIFTGQALLTTSPAGSIGNLALDLAVKSQQRLANAAFTDTGNAEQLANAFRGNIIWVPSIGWHIWDDGRWTPDTAGEVTEAAKDTFMTMLQSAQDDAARKWAHSSLSAGKLKSALELVKTIPSIIVEPLSLDAKPYELNTPGGVVNLTDGTIRPSHPATDRHTLRTAQTPKRIPTPKFTAFLEWAIEDAERIIYLQRLFGLAAIGKLIHHVFPIFLGVGANGKTTLLDIIAGVLGQYATVMPPRFLAEARGDKHPTEIMQLRGVRMAINSEVPPTARFNEDLLKQLTGETRLKARFMGKDFVEFENTATHFMAANHLMAVTVGGPGFWRRVRKIDFENQVLQINQNPYLVREILTEEGPGVLQWVIDGARDVLAHGLQDPEKVIAATRDYQLEEDTMARFLEEFIFDAPGTEIDRETVYGRFEQWMIRQNFRPMNAVKFGRELIALKPAAGLGSRTVFTNISMRRTWAQEITDDDIE